MPLWGCSAKTAGNFDIDTITTPPLLQAPEFEPTFQFRGLPRYKFSSLNYSSPVTQKEEKTSRRQILFKIWNQKISKISSLGNFTAWWYLPIAQPSHFLCAQKVVWRDFHLNGRGTLRETTPSVVFSDCTVYKSLLSLFAMPTLPNCLSELMTDDSDRRPDYVYDRPLNPLTLATLFFRCSFFVFFYRIQKGWWKISFCSSLHSPRIIPSASITVCVNFIATDCVRIHVSSPAIIKPWWVPRLGAVLRLCFEGKKWGKKGSGALISFPAFSTTTAAGRPRALCAYFYDVFNPVDFYEPRSLYWRYFSCLGFSLFSLVGGFVVVSQHTTTPHVTHKKTRVFMDFNRVLFKQGRERRFFSPNLGRWKPIVKTLRPRQSLAGSFHFFMSGKRLQKTERGIRHLLEAPVDTLFRAIVS